MSVDSPFRCVLDIRAGLGECPQWSTAEQALYWIDIAAPSLNRYDARSGMNVATPLPEAIGSFAFRRQGGFVLALRSGLWLADRQGRPTTRVAAAPYVPGHHRFNDGRCDRQGRFVVGSMNERRDAPSASLWRLDPDLAFHPLLDGMTVSNALAFSPDGRTMVHADTPTRTIRRYDYDPAAGVPSRGRVLAAFAGEDERPDGATVDERGCYWVALHRGGKVVRLSPEGRVLDEVPLPVRCPTMCALGGADLRTLYVTTSRQGRDADELKRLPQSGGLYAMKVDVPGIPEPAFTG